MYACECFRLQMRMKDGDAMLIHVHDIREYSAIDWTYNLLVRHLANAVEYLTSLIPNGETNIIFYVNLYLYLLTYYSKQQICELKTARH